jgi:tetratricopeptide (TPR) repeat protein
MNAEEEARRAFEKGKRLLEAGEHDAAIAAFSRAIRLKPDYYVAFFSRGTAYLRKGEHDKAIADFSEAIRLKPDYAEAFNNRGNAYARKDEFDKAIADYSEAIRLKPDDHMAFNNRGTAYLGKGEHDRAIADYSEAIRLKPDYAEAFFNRGNAYGMKGEYDRAIADFNEAIRLKPDYAEAFHNRGFAYFNKGEHDKAIADFNEAIRLKPDDHMAFFIRGFALASLDKHIRAVESYDRAIELRGGDFPEAWGAKNEVLQSLDKWLKERLPPKPHVEAYEQVTWVEERLHMFIGQRLRQAFGEEETGWWRQGVPEGIRKKCAERLEEDPNRRPRYNYTDLLDLKEIMDRNWRLFENDFRKVWGQVKTKKEFLEGLVHLNEIRKTVMHPVRGSVTEEDLSFVRQMREVVEKATPSG